MPWFKVDDKLHDHRKARAAGTMAMGVWTLAGSWSADNLTDGFIPASVLCRWGRPRDAARLVDSGLWYADEQDGEKGWRFHQWDERNPLRAQKLAEREAKAAAGRAGGFASGRSRRKAQPKQSASSLVELPTRPEPDPNLSDASVGASLAIIEPTINAGTLIAEWIEHCEERPPGRVIGQVSKELKTMIDEGVDIDRLRFGLAEWNRKGLHPSTLASVVHEVANRKAQPKRGDIDWDAAFERAAAKTEGA